MSSPIYYIDRIVIKRMKSDYLKNIPYEILLSDTLHSKNFNKACEGTILSGQLYDKSFYKEPWEGERKLKIIAKTLHGNVESNTLVLPNACRHQTFFFRIITEGNKQIYLAESPFQEEIIPLSYITGVDEDGIRYNVENGEQKKILFNEAFEAWGECMGVNDVKPKYIANCSECYPYQLRFFTKNFPNISFWREDNHFNRWKKLVRKIRSLGYDIFDAGRADVEGNSKYIKEKILGRKIAPSQPKTMDDLIGEFIDSDDYI